MHNLADDKRKIFYVDGRADMECRVVDHIPSEPDLYVTKLTEGFWGQDRNTFVRYLVVHKDNLIEKAI